MVEFIQQPYRYSQRQWNHSAFSRYQFIFISVLLIAFLVRYILPQIPLRYSVNEMLPVAEIIPFNPGCSTGALEDVVKAANGNNQDDVINLAPKCVYVLALSLNPTLTIASDNHHSLTIQGNGATISADNQMRIFYVQPGAILTVEQLTIRDGKTFLAKEGTLGGGIFNDQGTVTIRISILAANSAENGGAIFNDRGTITIEKSLFSHNQTYVDLYDANAKSAGVNSDDLESNLAAHGGGAIFNKLGTVSISNSTLANNQAANGAAIFNYGGTLPITFTTFSGNSATHGGGSIYNSAGFVFLTDTTLTDNSSGGGGVVSNRRGQLTIKGSILARNNSLIGGVIDNFEHGDVTITDSNLYNNSASYGGAIDNGGHLDISNTTFSDNIAENGSIVENRDILNISGSTFSNNIMTNSYGGGSVGNMKTARIVNSTFSGNSAVNGSAIYNQGTMDIIHSTFADNITSEKYGAAVFNDGGGPEITISYSILTNTLYGQNCKDHFGSDINQPAPNWISDGSCKPAYSGDPLLGPLKLYAPGTTMTYALLNGSGAIDVVPCDPDIHNDQRGVVRPQGKSCDLGAYEYTVTIAPDS